MSSGNKMQLQFIGLTLLEFVFVLFSVVYGKQTLAYNLDSSGINSEIIA